MERQGKDDCTIKQRVNPQKRRDKVYIGCGAGFGGDRPSAALKLLQRVKELNYLILECLAERTLADRYQVMLSGGSGYDSKISDWMKLLLPLAVKRNICIITNMGAMDPPGAQKNVIEIAESLGLSVSVAVSYEVSVKEPGISTYLGAAPIVECLEKYHPNVIITSRVADAALFLAPMVYELGWNWDDFPQLAEGILAGHLLECGCQLTGGYFMHPGDRYRSMSFQQLLDISLPYAEISSDGKVYVAKAEETGGLLNFSTCAEQLLYEVGDPSAYITPDMVVDFSNVSFCPISSSKVLCSRAKPSIQGVPEKLLQLAPKDCGWKGWGEISYGGRECVLRAKAAEYLVIQKTYFILSWMEEVLKGVNQHIVSYIIGLDSLKASRNSSNIVEDIRFRMDGLFELKEHALLFIREFTALYTNGPAGGGGISTGYKKEIVLEKQLVGREHIFWQTGVKFTNAVKLDSQSTDLQMKQEETQSLPRVTLPHPIPTHADNPCTGSSPPETGHSPAPSGQEIALYNVAHSRAGDKGNDLNFSVIPHCPSDFDRLKTIITPEWVKRVLSVLLNSTSFPDSDADNKRDKWIDEHVKVEIYEVSGIHSLNVLVRNVLDGGVNCSRRIDRHGKTISDLILSQQVVLPPIHEA
ncbi:uncharacterized protein LOC111016330 isoform X1 [Momordica charantia]|uniref:Uncharacterized protein LOC111016330 isoform X1 n=1 Tax=Momordica charantia TaxID=3673 RepID=A0A6J1D163_MOMCH|nr:uncharacterized protein LOC111016330 isoform X1 [Momordica charantia]XP_022147384.1 uncharacterized protein LOC111016330 isoform X1 [Momordica charantia]